MPVLFGSLTALVLALSAWIAFKNKAEYDNQIALRQKEETNYKIEVKEFNDLTEAWETAIAEKEAFADKNEVLAGELTTLDEKIETLKAEVTQKKSDRDRLQQEIDDANSVMDKVGGARALVPKIKGLRSDVANLKQSIEDGNAQKRVENEAAGRSQPSLNTSIKTVYSSWGFVTLTGGDVDGVVPGSTLEVVRNGETVAQLKVTTVEENRAAANIVRESVGPDVFLRAGDKVRAIAVSKPVVPEKTKAAKITAN